MGNKIKGLSLLILCILFAFSTEAKHKKKHKKTHKKYAVQKKTKKVNTTTVIHAPMNPNQREVDSIKKEKMKLKEKYIKEHSK